MTDSSTISTAALILGAIGSLLAVASLTWQMATFKLSGSRVKVKLRIAALGNAGALTGPVDSNWLTSLQRYQSMGYTPCLAIDARNIGRLAVDVIGCKVLFSNGMTYYPVDSPANPPSNYRLEHGQTKTWFVSITPLQAAVDAAAELYRENPKPLPRHTLFNAFAPPPPDGGQRIKLSLELGTGKIRKTRERFFLPPNRLAPPP